MSMQRLQQFLPGSARSAKVSCKSNNHCAGSSRESTTMSPIQTSNVVFTPRQRQHVLHSASRSCPSLFLWSGVALARLWVIASNPVIEELTQQHISFACVCLDGTYGSEPRSWCDALQAVGSLLCAYSERFTMSRRSSRLVDRAT